MEALNARTVTYSPEALIARLTDTEPVREHAVVCAWCLPVRDPMAPQVAGFSHTICPTCLATIEAELEAEIR